MQPLAICFAGSATMLARSAACRSDSARAGAIASLPPTTLDHAIKGHVCDHLLPLRGLRHLSVHGLMNDSAACLMEEMCNAAGALPQLISLHLVRMPCHSLSAFTHLCS